MPARKSPYRQQVRELFAGVSVRDVAMVGGVAGAIGLGGYALYLLSNQKAIDTYTGGVITVMKDYQDELDQFVKQNGTGGLTQTQKDALDAKLKLAQKLIDAAAAAAAQGQFPFVKFVEQLFILGVIVVGLKWGPSAAKGFMDVVQSRGKPQTSNAFGQLFQGVEAVGLASTGSVSLATAFYTTTMASDSLLAVTSLQLQQVTLQAELANLSGVALIAAQIELASIAADVALVPFIFASVPPFL